MSKCVARVVVVWTPAEKLEVVVTSLSEVPAASSTKRLREVLTNWLTLVAERIPRARTPRVPKLLSRLPSGVKVRTHESFEFEP